MFKRVKRVLATDIWKDKTQEEYELEKRLVQNAEKIAMVASFQKDIQRLSNMGDLDEASLAELCNSFKDRVYLEDDQIVRIARNEASLAEILDMMPQPVLDFAKYENLVNRNDSQAKAWQNGEQTPAEQSPDEILKENSAAITELIDYIKNLEMAEETSDKNFLRLADLSVFLMERLVMPIRRNKRNGKEKEK